jgi:TM2 domain-containing membrane protein YozV
MRSTGIASLLSLLIPGLGQVYAGRMARGIAFFFGIFSLLLVAPATSFAVMSAAVSSFMTARAARGPMPNDESTTNLILVCGWMFFVGFIVASIAVWIWGIFDAGGCASDANHRLQLRLQQSRNSAPQLTRSTRQ